MTEQTDEGERMHVVTVRFADSTKLGTKIQRVYDESFFMPQGSWRLIEPSLVEFAVILDGEVPFVAELGHLKSALNEVGVSWEITKVGDEEEHRDLDPCFAA